MKSIWIGIVLLLNFFRCSPHLMILMTHRNKRIIEIDTKRWLEFKKIAFGPIIGFIYLLSFFREFRNLFYYRIGKIHHILNIFCPKLSTLFINSEEIGEGLYISHGFATGISAKSIGKNCYIGHQVSIGNFKGFPRILNNVTIYAGAVVLGDITIGNNSIIGANASVFQDIPDNCTVYPASPRIMQWNDRKPFSDSTNESPQDY